MGLRRRFGAGISDIEGPHDSLRLLAHFLVWDAENCRISHRRMCQPLSARRTSVEGLHAIHCEQPRPDRRAPRPITKSRLSDRGLISTNVPLSPKYDLGNRKVDFTPYPGGLQRARRMKHLLIGITAAITI